MRAPTRIGVDRAWIVIGCVIAVVGLGLAKPWEHPTGPSVAVAQAPQPAATSADAILPAVTANPTADSTATPASQPTAPPEIRPSPTPVGLYLELATRDLAGVMATSETGWFVANWRPIPVEIPLVADFPRTGALGSTCSGGQMLNEGTNEFALALAVSDADQSPHMTLWRLFAKGTPLPVPVLVETAGQTGIVLVKSSQGGWGSGDYALTIERGGDVKSFVFCIGRSFRMVDYSLLTLVPSGVDSRAARRDMLSE